MGAVAELPRSWRLARGGTVTFAAVCDELTIFGEQTGRLPAAPPPRETQRHPAWQLVLSSGAPVTASDATGRGRSAHGLLVPPGVTTTMRRPTDYVSLWVDPYALPVMDRRTVHALDSEATARLLQCTMGDFGPERLRRVLSRVFGEPPEVDDRLLGALRRLDAGFAIDDLAEQVGISPRRLRQLSAQHSSGPLRSLRRWYRLREAGLRLPFQPAAVVAAGAGFADQAHLTRTMVALCGRTPSSAPSFGG